MIYYLTILFLSFFSCFTTLFPPWGCIPLLSLFSPCFIIFIFYDKAPLMGDKTLFRNVFSFGCYVKNTPLMAGKSLFFNVFSLSWYVKNKLLIGNKPLFSSVFSLGRNVEKILLTAVSYFLLKPINLLFFNCKEVIYDC